MLHHHDVVFVELHASPARPTPRRGWHALTLSLAAGLACAMPAAALAQHASDAAPAAPASAPAPAAAPAAAEAPAPSEASAPAPAPAEAPAAADAPAAAAPAATGGGRRRGSGTAAADTKEQAPPEPSYPPATEGPPGVEEPLGFEGPSSYGERALLPIQSVATPDRWRIGWPRWDRYGRQAVSDPILQNATGSDIPFTLGHPLNPYDRNFFKGDYPILGQDLFFNFTGVSDTLVGYRTLPTPSGNNAALPGSFDIFKDGRQFFLNQNFILNFDLIKGYTAYRPIDMLIRVAPVINMNYVRLKENAVNVSPLAGDERYDTFSTLQEAFIELHLGDTSEYFDIFSVKAGRQLFVSDFRGFIFNAISDGVKFSGNAANNRVQYNLAYFNQPEIDTNSGLNELNWRQQQVLIANAYVQDFIWLGYTIQGSFHWNHDTSDERFDTNGFPVRPDLAGSVAARDLDAYYVGFAGDGHIGRLNISHALYYAFGSDDNNPIAGRQVDISAYMGALELSIDYDWLRPKISFLYASGDEDPEDGTAQGFDGIFDDPFFAGGPTSFFQSNSFRIFGVGLDGGRSFYNSLKASKFEGQANFVNPGTILVNGGFDAEITPKLRAQVNANAIWFANTDALELFLNQPDIESDLGIEVNGFLQYRPLLNNNVIFSVGSSVFFPGSGFQDVYGNNETLWQVFTGITLTY